ncbi:protein FAM135A-like isoform X2 [Stegodyphus dumicola]|uniref:protein FAM135A-like isoform X2 n=1 Tax=Stegodyphus dumicola TaxID=202533 RepID=UPI0015AD38C8|nr:protein FAM135A-like isoform X2 [Stegodyphus dumicola]
MGELQCTLEFSVELHKFINVDLFQRGFYQVRSTLKASPKLPVKIEVNLPKNSSCSLVFPACIVNGTAVSKTFQILYKNEEIILDDIIIFKVHALVDGHKVRESLLKADFQIIVELWFTDQSFGPDHHNSIHCVSTRTLLLHFDPSRGLHHHIPLLFDYFHLCAVTITIHASVIAVCQPYISLQKPSKQNFLTGSPRLLSKKSHSSIEAVLFGPQVGRSVPCSARLCRARIIHWELCFLLLSAHNSLCRKVMEYMTLLPPWQQLKLDALEDSSYLRNLSDFAKECHKHVKSSPVPSREQLFGPIEGMDSEEFLMKANSDIAQICGALILLWQKFLETVIGNEKVRQHLSRQRHFQRVKRFSEAFFIIERSRDSALAPCDSSVEAYQEVSECLRKSSYFNLLPPLEVECLEFDGDLNSLPIVYEEHYQETARRGSSNSQSSQSESAVSLTDVNFLVEENIEEGTEAVRRNSQGSLGQKYRSPDISATPTSPSAYSWCPESMVSSSTSAKSNCIPSKKLSLKEKIMNNFKAEFDSDYDENVLPASSLSRASHKINVRSKINLRSRTVNFLRQLKKPQFNHNPTVVLLGVKKLDSYCSVASGSNKSSRMPFALDSGIRHSQSTLSVMSTLYAEGNVSIPNSESMPDLTSGFVPPPPPPPTQKPRLKNTDSEKASESSLQNQGTLPCSLCSAKNDIEDKIKCSHIHSMSAMHTEPEKHKRNDDSVFENLNDAHSDFTPSDPFKDTCGVPSISSVKEQMNKQSEYIVSSQPLKSGGETIFNRVVKEKSHKSNSLVPLSIASEESNTSTGEVVFNSNICDICPPSPPVQFKDPPDMGAEKISSTKNGKSSKVVKKVSPVDVYAKSNFPWPNDNCLTSIICQGTLFFPKPPAQFGDETVKTNKTKEDNSENSSSETISSAEEPSSSCKEIEYSPKNAGDVEINSSKFFEFIDTKCTIMEMLSDLSESDNSYLPADSDEGIAEVSLNSSTERQRSCSLFNTNVSSGEDTPSIRRASVIGTEMISFVKAKEEFRKQLRYSWLWYSDFPNLASGVPYFQCDSDLRAFSPEGMHLVVCVHGLDGNSADLRLVKTYLELGLPTVNFEFLMSERNQGETFDDFDTMTDRLVSEITYYIEVYGLKPAKISFIGHSLGNIIIRSALTRPEMKPYMNRLHTFLSLSGPHLGTLYNSSGLVNMGMWFMQKWKKSGSLLQLAMKDASDLRQTFLYKLSQKSGLEHFRNILLFGSSQDRYVPLHSARIELCKPALKDTSLQGMVYREMVTNLIQPIIQNPEIALLRYDVHHALPSSANSLIGRAAHIAVLDSELFIEKFLAVCGLRFFI